MIHEEQIGYLSLGSNLGDSRENLQKAIELIEFDKFSCQIISISNVYKTAAWGKTDQPDFLNLIIEIKTKLSAEMLMNYLLEIEKSMGRIRIEKWGERIIDIDIIFYGNEIRNSEKLIIPHPEMQNRKFVLFPLVEINPKIVHPIFLKNSSQLLSECTDESSVIDMGKLYK